MYVCRNPYSVKGQAPFVLLWSHGEVEKDGRREREVHFIKKKKKWRENEGRDFADDWGRMKRLIGLLSGCSFWRIYKMSGTRSHFLSFCLRRVLMHTHKVHATSHGVHMCARSSHQNLNNKRRHKIIRAIKHTFSPFCCVFHNNRWCNVSNKTRRCCQDMCVFMCTLQHVRTCFRSRRSRVWWTKKGMLKREVDWHSPKTTHLHLHSSLGVE